MAISRPRPGRYEVSGADNIVNLRWSSIYGRATDDGLTINRKNIGGWGFIDMGSGNDTVTLAASGDYTLQLRGVETIKTTSDAATLSFRSDVTTATDGSFTAITAGYGVQDITFTGAVRDSSLSLGDLEDEAIFDTSSNLWGYEKVDGVLRVYDLTSGYSVQVDSSVEWIQIGDGTGTDGGRNGRWQVSAIQDNSTGGYSLAAAVSTNPVIFNATDIELSSTIETAGFASAYGFDTGASFNNNDIFSGFVYIGWTTINAPYYQNPTTTISISAQSHVVDGYVWTYFWQDPNNQSSDYGPKSGAYRLILGSSNADTSGAMDQSVTDTLVARSSEFSFYNHDMLPGYAMYGFGGDDAIKGGNDSDTIYGGTGNDTITGGSGNDKLYGEDGDDTFVYASLAAFIDGTNILDDIDGGADADTIQIDAAITLTANNSLADLISVETLKQNSVNAASIVLNSNAKLGSVTKIDVSSSTAASTVTLTGVTTAVSVTGGSGADALTGGAGGDTITGGGGIDQIVAAAGDDVIIIAASTDDAVGESYDGGAHTNADTLRIAGTTTVNLADDTLTGIETLELTKDAAGTASSAVQTVTISAAQKNAFTTIDVNAGDILLINGLTGATVAGTSAIDKFVFASGDTGVVLSSFTSATDKLNIDNFTTSASFDASHTVAVNAATAVTIANGKAYLITAGAAGDADGAAAAAALISSAGAWTDGSNGDIAYFVVVDNNSTGVFKYTEAGTAEVDTAELSLVATISSVTVAGDYLFA